MDNSEMIESKSKKIPEVDDKIKQLPEQTDKTKELPPVVNPENVVTIGEESIEIKPTKLKYQRNRTAAFQRVLELYPLPDILAMDKGYIDSARDGDKCVFDWCCAVTDNSGFVTRHYDEMDTSVIERLLKIFKRLNAINEKEENAKNREAKETNS